MLADLEKAESFEVKFWMDANVADLLEAEMKKFNEIIGAEKTEMESELDDLGSMIDNPPLPPIGAEFEFEQVDFSTAYFKALQECLI
jgi:hypothetical protein